MSRRLVVLRSLYIFGLTASLSGCAGYGVSSLEPGKTTETEVRRIMGDPALRIAASDGSTQLAYPTGPMGTKTFMAHVAADGRLTRIEQVLDEEHFARIATGRSTQEDVRRIIGPPFNVGRFPRQNYVAWDYRFKDAWGYRAELTVLFDPNGVVAEKFVERIETAFPSD
jgi:outer membrane protein assembly factor BamE (lipoprotein component of BamABCDE complex)